MRGDVSVCRSSAHKRTRPLHLFPSLSRSWVIRTSKRLSKCRYLDRSIGFYTFCSVFRVSSETDARAGARAVQCGNRSRQNAIKKDQTSRFDSLLFRILSLFPCFFLEVREIHGSRPDWLARPCVSVYRMAPRHYARRRGRPIARASPRDAILLRPRARRDWPARLSRARAHTSGRPVQIRSNGPCGTDIEDRHRICLVERAPRCVDCNGRKSSRTFLPDGHIWNRTIIHEVMSVFCFVAEFLLYIQLPFIVLKYETHKFRSR